MFFSNHASHADAGRNDAAATGGGGLATIIASLTLLIPATREPWIAALVVLAAGWLPFLANQRLRRYRRIEKLISEHEATLPHYVIRLQLVESAEGLSGGHLSTG